MARRRIKPDEQLSNADRLDLVSLAWGNQEGFVFFPWIDRDTQVSSGSRTAGYDEGPAFAWPSDRDKILTRMDHAEGKDLYWCPNIFEYESRRSENAMDEHALWADLDEVDPRGIEDEYRPTLAWETSPGRYQALWVIYPQYDMLGSSWPGNENQRLTRHLGADQSGWDTTQLLRLPGWPNHKPDYVSANDGNPVAGNLLWADGRKFYPNDFEDLPEIDPGQVIVEDVLESQVEAVDTADAWGRVKLKVSKRVRELYGAREVHGDRSNALWEIERDMADAGLTPVEIVALVRPLVWNKYAGRHDEIKRLVIEAQKAVGLRSTPDEVDLGEAASELRAFTNLFTLIKTAKAPVWLVDNIWAEGSCGFVAGQPKSWKSWVALDLMLSVASGRPFLDRFHVKRARPVAYVQEEDPLAMLKDRLGKVWPSKLAPTLELDDDGSVWMNPPVDTIQAESLPIDALVRGGFTLTDDVWMHWLASALEAKREQVDGGYGMLVLDPLMMVAGDVEENRAQEMTTKIFKPLKQLAEEYRIAICLVHHMRKSDPSRPQRGGQLMLGSVANHAWAEDSLYLMHGGKGKLKVEHESKHASGSSFIVDGLSLPGWSPTVLNTPTVTDKDRPAGANAPAEKRTRVTGTKALRAIMSLGLDKPHTTMAIADTMGISRQGCLNQLRRLQDAGLIEKEGTSWKVSEKGQKVGKLYG